MFGWEERRNEKNVEAIKCLVEEEEEEETFGWSISKHTLLF